MSMLDTFAGNGFDRLSLTAAINELPFVPSRLGRMGLFASKGVPDKTVAVENKRGVLTLYKRQSRGTPGQATPPSVRELRDFRVPHIPVDDAILADDAQGVRAFGQETAVQTAQSLMNERLASIKQSMEATWEFHRMGAAKGIVLDAGGDTIFNFFTEFGITQKSVDFVFGTATTDIRAKIRVVKRHIAKQLGLSFFDRIHCLCGFQWFESLIGHAITKTAFERFQDGSQLRDDVSRGFQYAGVTFEEWVGSVGEKKFIEDNEAHFFPVGVPQLFQAYWAPAPMDPFINTIGVPLYVSMERMKHGVGFDLHVESNPLMMCTRPATLVKGTTSN